MYSNEELMKVMERKPLGDFCPYIDWVEKQESTFFSDIISELKNIELTEIDVDMLHTSIYFAIKDMAIQ